MTENEQLIGSACLFCGQPLEPLPRERLWRCPVSGHLYRAEHPGLSPFGCRDCANCEPGRGWGSFRCGLSGFSRTPQEMQHVACPVPIRTTHVGILFQEATCG
jgi:hypothetical protein